ncbi:LOW QUALITY PROTEIN: hypothetical protein Cgig2_022194 [Carnegiea gigantea]|uniref:Reverse transcriptase zinc-binding domain-containing protein n=1 Tax=Carnegiea gigantea TaxID=171969 RepID=A0A9Q1GW77_9CARY|nr:LOW QUALITY PROTEIN: hypothetical protein Cgig2_022194 [Carnegiea gigantea]
MSKGLSNHTPIIFSFPQCPKPRSTFQFCEMWTKDKDFKDIVKHSLAQHQRGSSLKTLQHILSNLRHSFRQLNKNNKQKLEGISFRHNLCYNPTNQELLLKGASSRDHYISINQSAMLLVKQQSKAEWLGFGDECTRYDQRVEGFEVVLRVMTTFYKKLLGEMDHHITHVDQQIQLCLSFTDFDIKKVVFLIPNHKSPGPDGYNSAFYKACWEDIGPLVCSAIKEFFSGGHLPSFYRQTKLVLLPKVPNPQRAKDFRAISCCNLLMNAFHEFTRSSGLTVNLDKSNIVFGGDCLHIQQECLNITGFTEGQLPFRYLGMPITASRFTKEECSILVEKITPKVHISIGQYSVIWHVQFLSSIFILPQEVVNQVMKMCRNYLWGGSENYKKILYVAWDKICTPKKHRGLGVKNLRLWNMACIAKLLALEKATKSENKFKVYPRREYKVKEGYNWLLQEDGKPQWAKLVWSRISIPRHSFTVWFFIHNKLPQGPKTHEHLFFECIYARDIWQQFCAEWDIMLQLDGKGAFITSLIKLRTPRKMRGLIQAMVSAVIYHIWLARNRMIFKSTVYPAQEILKEIKSQLIQRVLQIHQNRKNYNACIDYLRKTQ